MPSLSLPILIQFLIAVVANIAALGILPATAGFTRVSPTVACIGLFVLNIWMLARLIQQGAPLSILAPVMAAVIPLTTIVIGVVIYGENSAPLRIILLLGACALTAGAAVVKA